MKTKTTRFKSDNYKNAEGTEAKGRRKKEDL
jgi:hypothetical protein